MCVYGADAESALRFLFNAMTQKEDSPFRGILDQIYLDNGPVVRSGVFEGLGDQTRAYLDKLIDAAPAKGAKPKDVIYFDALDLLAEQLSTPLQLVEHLSRAFTEAFQVGSRPLTRDIIEETLSVDFDDLHARLARIGYTVKALAEQVDVADFSVYAAGREGFASLSRTCQD